MGTSERRLLELAVELDQHFVLLAAALGVAVEHLARANKILTEAKGLLDGQEMIPDARAVREV